MAKIRAKDNSCRASPAFLKANSDEVLLTSCPTQAQQRGRLRRGSEKRNSDEKEAKPKPQTTHQYSTKYKDTSP